MRKGIIFILFLGLILLLAQGVSGLWTPPDLSKPKGVEEHPLGPVYDAENRLLAESVKTKGLVLLPQAFEINEKNLRKLSSATGKSMGTLTLLLSEKKEPLFLQSPSQKGFPTLEGINGIYVQQYYVRHYPFGELKPLLAEGEETSLGLEDYYEKILSQPNTSLTLAIKIEWQKALAQDLRKALKKLKAQKGLAIVLDLADGRIKALSCQGGIDLFFHELPLSIIQEPFEEGFYNSMYQSLGDYLRGLGFGEPTGVDLPKETVGVVPLEVESLEEVYASPLQILKALAILATGKYFSPKIALNVRSGKDFFAVPVVQEELEDLVPRFSGGHWWWGGSRRLGKFLIAGLWPRKSPRLAYIVYITGVKVWGLPCYYTRFIPQSLRLYPRNQGQSQSPSPKVVKADKMPDVRGLTLKAALERLSSLGLKVKFSGFGVTVKQWPAPGVSLKNVKECYLVLK